MIPFSIKGTVNAAGVGSALALCLWESLFSVLIVSLCRDAVGTTFKDEQAEVCLQVSLGASVATGQSGSRPGQLQVHQVLGMCSLSTPLQGFQNVLHVSLPCVCMDPNPEARQLNPLWAWLEQRSGKTHSLPLLLSLVIILI